MPYSSSYFFHYLYKTDCITHTQTNIYTQMGYAHLSQRGKGLHLRQYSRAFIIQDDSGKRAAFISVDGAMQSYTIKRDVSI